ncbi:sensor histidine kinase [Herbiconiux solani]|uniref:sensor histidine kinase n=1 Tax=Herbiconiux solani TaxID=661329 RepID=UPI00082413C5|nr:ATP-binding protein [Herbiconiux solani]
MIRGFRRWSIAAKLFALQFIVVVALTATAVAISWADARADVERDAAERSLAVAETLAQDPFVIESVQTSDPTAALQPYAVSVMDAADIDFITVMSPDRVRYTHRDPAEIGRRFLGNIDRALAGQSFTETYTGTLGPSVRAVVPIEDDGRVVALVSAGITVSNTQVALGGRIGTVLAAAGIAVLLGGLASWGLSRYLRRVTAGRGAEEMSRMFAYYEGVLHAIGEGLVLQDTSRGLVLYNDRAAELLGLPPAGVTAGEVVALSSLEAPAVEPAVLELLASAEVTVDEIVITPTHVLVVDRDRVVARRGARTSGPFAGTVTIVRDHTELQELTGELATMTTLSDALRSQAHEFANRLHTMIALIELDRAGEAAELASSELELSQQLADRILTAADEPVLLALLLGKSAQAAERGLRLDVDVPEHLPGGAVPPRELITIVGNLIDNAMDAVAGLDPSAQWVRVGVEPRHDGGLRIAVEDGGTGPGGAGLDSSGPGGAGAFELGATTKPLATGAGSPELGGGRGIGLALVRQAVGRLGGTIAVDGSRFTVDLPARVTDPRPEAVR